MQGIIKPWAASRPKGVSNLGCAKLSIKKGCVNSPYGGQREPGEPCKHFIVGDVSIGVDETLSGSEDHALV